VRMRVASTDVRYITVKLGLVSTQADSLQQDKPTISLLIKSFLPTVTVVQHYFALPTSRYDNYESHGQLFRRSTRHWQISEVIMTADVIHADS